MSEQPLYGEQLTYLQEQLPTLSPNSVQVVVQGATHKGLLAKRDHARSVIRAIRQVIDAHMTKQPLTA